MKKYIIILSSLIFPVITSAHGTEGIIEEDLGISHQIEEISPFTHFSEGHWFAGVMLLVLWLSLAYTIYSMMKKFNK